MKVRWNRGLLLLVWAGLAVCCGGSTPHAAAPQAPSTGIAVAGTYSIARTLISQQNCNPPIPGATESVTGVITQNGLQFRLVNSDTGRFEAILGADATFTNGRVHAIGTAGEPYDLLFEGRFTTTGFTATVTVDDFRPNGTCHEAVAWTGTKQGAPNVIP